MLDSRAKVTLAFLIRELEGIIEVKAEHPDPLSLTHTRLSGEETAYRTAIAHLTGVYGVKTPVGGVIDWLPTLKEAVK